METLIQKVTAVLESAFPGVEIRLATRRGVEKIGGLLIWSGFAGKSQWERQALIWNVLRGSLTSDEQHQIGTILTVSPSELEANRETISA